MLRQHVSMAGSIDFVPDGHEFSSRSNTFTVIVGRNGTGKSRLLRSIARHCLESKIPTSILAREDRLGAYREDEARLDMSKIPSGVICVSTSPFDRFPTLRREYLFAEGYSYLGLRGLNSQNLSVAYLSRVVFSLIEAAHRSVPQARAISDVLKYLGYEGGIRVAVQMAPVLRAHGSTSDGFNREFIKSCVYGSFGPSSEGDFLLRSLAEAPESRIEEVSAAWERTFSFFRAKRMEIEVGEHGVSVTSPDVRREDILTLLGAGALRLRNVVLHKAGMDRPIMLGEASSGEQAVLMSLLGISSRIRDGALICIDEPEICLHPEWQEKYIELLYHSFSHFNSCHFVIATHSPQIISRLPQGDCFVVAMEDGVARLASEFSNRSIDFQLAEIFNAPGYRNEYLSRLALNTFSKVSKSKCFDAQSLIDMASLRKSSFNLKSGDPLLDLIRALEKMVARYA